MRLQGKSALVTGASRGLGAALVRQIAERGGRVVAVARAAEPLEALVASVPGEVHALAADVGDKLAVHPLVGAAAALVGDIDVVIHSASTLGPTPLRLLLDTECEDFERVLAVNLIGPFRITRALAGGMALRRRGVIVHVSSDASVEAYARWGAYSVSKAALDHLARLWAVELAVHGVTSFSVDPGEMDTEMHAAAIPDADRAALARPDAVAARILEMIEQGDRILPGARLSVGAWRPA